MTVCIYVVAAMYESTIIAVLLLLSFTTLEVLSNKFRGGIIMVRLKAGGAAKEVDKFLYNVCYNLYILTNS